ncbi:hypothetical protein Cni_G13726 [Canna indica]|uniref:L-lactate dehydrogenase n=1 Tax=Canna indica TaxID=4628 RepID=A0AAQ3KD56_9LILI|nr:hypothetical protein Cni_G13726 [Canna indica]
MFWDVSRCSGMLQHLIWDIVYDLETLGNSTLPLSSPHTKIVASSDYSVTTNSNLYIITAGARQLPGEMRLNLLQRNLALFKHIVPSVAKYSSGTLLVVVSNPVDVLTYIVWKLFRFSPNQVIGSSTNLNSSRFRFLLADHLEVNAQDVQACMVGEHEDSSVALWSSINIGGVSILSQLTDEKALIEQGVLEKIRKLGGGGERIRGYPPQGLHLLGRRLLGGESRSLFTSRSALSSPDFVARQGVLRHSR